MGCAAPWYRQTSQSQPVGFHGKQVMQVFEFKLEKIGIFGLAGFSGVEILELGFVCEFLTEEGFSSWCWRKRRK